MDIHTVTRSRIGNPKRRTSPKGSRARHAVIQLDQIPIERANREVPDTRLNPFSRIVTASEGEPGKIDGSRTGSNNVVAVLKKHNRYAGLQLSDQDERQQ